jgi:hypothetical protein
VRRLNGGDGLAHTQKLAVGTSGLNVRLEEGGRGKRKSVSQQQFFFSLSLFAL